MIWIFFFCLVVGVFLLRLWWEVGVEGSGRGGVWVGVGVCGLEFSWLWGGRGIWVLWLFFKELSLLVLC